MVLNLIVGLFWFVLGCSAEGRHPEKCLSFGHFPKVSIVLPSGKTSPKNVFLLGNVKSGGGAGFNRNAKVLR